ncbi:MAG: rubrerythrin family protein [Chloroflexota bacterium]|nr:rubrerythrin family protein [Chloroflexota bacterium]
MKKMTEEFLKTAFAGESQAHMKYLIFSDVAEQEGRPNLARMFRAIAYAEQVHATNHFRVLGDINDSEANIGVCIEGENFEIEEMYPVYNTVAKFQGERGAEQSTHFALEAEKIHSAWYTEALQAVKAEGDVKVGNIHICSVCGHTVEGEAPERCPVCGAPRERFKLIP